MNDAWEITESEFQRLIRERPYRRRIARLLREWGYHLAGYGDATQVTDQAGTVIDAVALYAAMRRDPARQRDLYQAAMDLWR